MEETKELFNSLKFMFVARKHPSASASPFRIGIPPWLCQGFVVRSAGECKSATSLLWQPVKALKYSQRLQRPLCQKNCFASNLIFCVGIGWGIDHLAQNTPINDHWSVTRGVKRKGTRYQVPGGPFWGTQWCLTRYSVVPWNIFTVSAKASQGHSKPCLHLPTVNIYIIIVSHYSWNWSWTKQTAVTLVLMYQTGSGT